jgi:hypothetical protein
VNYRFKRRAFLSALGGAVGLETMLGNLEAAEIGTPSPPRLLATAWPIGTIPYHYLPTGSGRDFTMSRILMPFEERGLREDLVILFGLTHSPMGSTSGGGAEAGTVMMMTGQRSPGTRSNGGESDDSVAGGPSFDQIFLKHVPALARPGRGYANAIGDARVDSFETSTQCLSYSHVTREITAAFPSGGTIVEHVPLLPTLNPIDFYTELFGSFVPGGTTSDQMSKLIRLRKSVLDGTLGQLSRLRDLAPASEREKIEIHTEAIRKVERELSDAVAEPADCALPTAPDAAIQALSGSRSPYNNPIAAEPDAPLVEQIGKLHLSLIRAAFQCDLTRVATFQWCPTQPHVAMENLDPNRPDTYFMHHPLSHQVFDNAWYTGPPPSTGDDRAYLYEAMVRANIWYFEKYADVFGEWKTATDGFGGALLDHTIIPLMTDTANALHARQPLPALILGGRALGMQGGQFQNFQGDLRNHNDLWMSVAQALFPDSADVMGEMVDETFMRSSVSPIAGVWSRPA